MRGVLLAAPPSPARAVLLAAPPSHAGRPVGGCLPPDMRGRFVTFHGIASGGQRGGIGDVG